MHSEKEIAIMEAFNTVEKTSEKIDDGCKYTENVLKKGNAIEVSTHDAQ